MKVELKTNKQTLVIDCQEEDLREMFDGAIRNNPEFFNILKDVVGTYLYETSKEAANKALKERVGQLHHQGTKGSGKSRKTAKN